MTITPSTVETFVWVFCSLYLVYKIPWTIALRMNLHKAQATDSLVRIAFAGAQILLPGLALATVTFPDIHLIRTACILLASALLLALLVKAPWFSAGHSFGAAEFAARLLDGVMLIISLMVAVNFTLLR